MRKAIIFKDILDICSEVCGVRASSIIGKLRDQAVVDARAIAAHTHTKVGFSTKDIALNAKRLNNPSEQFPSAKSLLSSSRRINYLRNLYITRYESSDSFRILADSVDRKVRAYISEK